MKAKKKPHSTAVLCPNHCDGHKHGHAATSENVNGELLAALKKMDDVFGGRLGLSIGGPLGQEALGEAKKAIFKAERFAKATEQGGR